MSSTPSSSSSSTSSLVPYRQIRAQYDDSTITVYQAYKVSIATAAVQHQKLDASPDFKPSRMTWVKPSWAWMMYRAGYSFKDPGQARILAIKLPRTYFQSLLGKGVLSTHSPKDLEAAAGRSSNKDRNSNGNSKAAVADEVRIQWDPERDAKLRVLPYRSIQIGIPGTTGWCRHIVAIEDVTDTARELKEKIDAQPDVAIEELEREGLVPAERPFPVSEELQRILRMDVASGKDH